MIFSAFDVLTYTSCGRKIPYGRYNQAEPFMSSQVYLYANVAWMIQELPSISLFFYYTFFTNGQQLSHLPNKLIMSGLLVHYFHRYKPPRISYHILDRILYSEKFNSVCNSAIHKAAGRRSAGGWNDPQGSFQPLAPFTAYGSFRNCTRQNHGTAGNCEAGGFVNSAAKRTL